MHFQNLDLYQVWISNISCFRRETEDPESGFCYRGARIEKL